MDQALGAKDNLPKDKYFRDVPKANEDGGVYGGRNSYTTQGGNRKQGHREESNRPKK